MALLTTIEEFEDELDALVETNPDDAGLIDGLIDGNPPAMRGVQKSRSARDFP